MPRGQQPILELHDITKAFGGVEALRGVDFALTAGEIHGLVGENGAGKSTLMKIIAGVHADFSGRFVLDGHETRLRSVRDAHAAGIAMVHQELSVAPDLTVAENVFLGSQPTNRLGLVQWRRMAHEAGEQLKRFGIDVDPMSRLGALPIGLQQLIEIARVLSSGARIIILDEPTSALSPPEVERLFATLKRLRDDGTSIVFISHFIEDILRVSDTVTVFRNGRKVAETAASETSKPALIEAMIGKGREALEETYIHDIMLPPPTDQPVVLNADGLTLAGRLREVSFEARAGAAVRALGRLWGGTHRRVGVANWLGSPPRLLVLCEPTRGMDVGAKNDVIHIVRDLRAKGLAIIVLSTEPETVLSLADRVIVLKRGAVVREFANEQISKDRLLEAA